jgi:hypothetical protein
VTFGECPDALLAAKASGWRNAKHRAQWAMTLNVYAAQIRPVPVAEVSTQDVLKVVQPLWLEKPESVKASRPDRGRARAKPSGSSRHARSTRKSPLRTGP